jgi:hypothetical protein
LRVVVELAGVVRCEHRRGRSVNAAAGCLIFIDTARGYLADTIAWQHRYCVFMTVVYVLSIAMGVFMVTFRNEGASGHNSAEDLFITGMVLIVMGVVLTIAYGVAPRLVPAPWVWTYHLILIAFAFTSPCCLPIAIPLLIRWIKPDTKQYYGRA